VIFITTKVFNFYVYSHVQPVTLPQQGQQFDSATAIVSGWGTLYDARWEWSDVLRSVEVPLVSDPGKLLVIIPE